MTAKWKEVTLGSLTGGADPEIVWTDGESTAWVEEIDEVAQLAVGGMDGVAGGYVPLSALERILATFQKEERKS